MSKHIALFGPRDPALDAKIQAAVAVAEAMTDEEYGAMIAAQRFEAAVSARMGQPGADPVADPAAVRAEVRRVFVRNGYVVPAL